MIYEIIQNVQRELEGCGSEAVIRQIIYEFAGKMEIQCAKIMSDFEKTLDFAVLEQSLADMCADFAAEILQEALNRLFAGIMLPAALKAYAGTRGMKFKEYREVTVTLGNGRRIRVISPYFVKTSPKGKRQRKKGPNGTGAHVGLEICGFIGHISPILLSDIAQMAILCPSFEIARAVFENRGIRLDVKAIHRICRLIGGIGLPLRGEISLNGDEELRGNTLVISIDGGRLRERVAKRGRKPEKLKRHGYRAQWREPRLFTIYLTDPEGNVIKEFKPLYDGTMDEEDGIFNILEKYLSVLDINNVEKIVFCGDGSKWIWKGVENILKKMKIDTTKIFQVLDYIHARQNLQEIINCANQDKQGVFAGKLEYFLQYGLIDAMEKSIKETIKDKPKQGQALNKWRNYFSENRKRMQYAEFKKAGLPCGSGHVESAIRRVVNLRLKAPGIFRKKEMAECFLFLRPQLLSGRWKIFMSNLTALTRRAFQPFYGPAADPLTTPEAA